MDDYSLASLTESKNEWCARLVNLLTQHIINGVDSIFLESDKICNENEESNKYLMTFQNLLSAIPTWNPITIQNEKKRIEKESGCKYLEDLITCVHIIQLKALTCIRVGEKQKKIDINIPSVDLFIHSIYINVARKLYTNIYLYEKDLYPLQIQKNKREIEYLVKEAILMTIRDNIPVEQILHSYMEENEDIEIPKNSPVTDVKENLDLALDNKKQTVLDSSINEIPINSVEKSLLTDEKLSIIATELKKDNDVNIVSIKEDKENDKDKNLEKIDKTGIDDTLVTLENNISEEKLSGKPTVIEFSDKDSIITENNTEKIIDAPKDLDSLNKLAEEKKINNTDEDDDKLDIGTDAEEIKLDILSL